MAVRPIDKQTMLELIIDAKRTDPETGSFAEWLAEYLVEHMHTLTPPNEPLTIEQLREMDGEPVWVIYDQDAAKTTPGFDPLTLWALVEVTKNSIFLTNNLGGRTAYAADQDLEWAGITVYCRPPEGRKHEKRGEKSHDVF